MFWDLNYSPLCHLRRPTPWFLSYWSRNTERFQINVSMGARPCCSSSSSSWGNVAIMKLFLFLSRYYLLLWKNSYFGEKTFFSLFTQPSTVYWTGSIFCMLVCLSVTIFFHILLLTLNYHSPPLYAGIFILLKLLKSKHWRRDQLRPV